MPKKKKYTFYICKDCEIDFIVKLSKKTFCPLCGENLFTEAKAAMWLERPFNYKRPWTKEDDELLLDGVKQGYSRQDIANALNRTRVAVNRRYSLLNRKQIG